MTQTLTTDQLKNLIEFNGPDRDASSANADSWEVHAMARELLANREAQPVAGELGEIRVGRLPTMNQEEYPGLGAWWVQLRIGENHDEILARVYGATPEEEVARARLLTAPPAPVVNPEFTGETVVPDEREIFEAAIDECRKSDSIDEHVWNHGVLVVMAKFEECRAATMAAAPEGGK